MTEIILRNGVVDLTLQAYAIIYNKPFHIYIGKTHFYEAHNEYVKERQRMNYHKTTCSLKELDDKIIHHDFNKNVVLSDKDLGKTTSLMLLEPHKINNHLLSFMFTQERSNQRLINIIKQLGSNLSYYTLMNQEEPLPYRIINVTEKHYKIIENDDGSEYIIASNKPLKIY